jgi:hypothetical protein
VYSSRVWSPPTPFLNHPPFSHPPSNSPPLLPSSPTPLLPSSPTPQLPLPPTLLLRLQGLSGPSAVLRFLRIFLGYSTGLITFLAFGLEPQLLQLWIKSTLALLRRIGCLHPEDPLLYPSNGSMDDQEESAAASRGSALDHGLSYSPDNEGRGGSGGHDRDIDSRTTRTRSELPASFRSASRLAGEEVAGRPSLQRQLQRQSSDPLRLRHSRAQAGRGVEMTLPVNFNTVSGSTGGPLAGELRQLLKQEARRQQIQRQRSSRLGLERDSSGRNLNGRTQQRSYEPLSVIGYFGTDMTPRETGARRRGHATQ